MTVIHENHNDDYLSLHFVTQTGQKAVLLFPIYAV
jgi:hypothetical protein